MAKKLLHIIFRIHCQKQECYVSSVNFLMWYVSSTGTYCNTMESHRLDPNQRDHVDSRMDVQLQGKAHILLNGHLRRLHHLVLQSKDKYHMSTSFRPNFRNSQSEETNRVKSISQLEYHLIVFLKTICTEKNFD